MSILFVGWPFKMTPDPRWFCSGAVLPRHRRGRKKRNTVIRIDRKNILNLLRVRVDIRTGSGAGTGAAGAIRVRDKRCFAGRGLPIKISGWRWHGGSKVQVMTINYDKAKLRIMSNSIKYKHLQLLSKMYMVGFALHKIKKREARVMKEESYTIISSNSCTYVNLSTGLKGREEIGQ